MGRNGLRPCRRTRPTLHPRSQSSSASRPRQPCCSTARPGFASPCRIGGRPRDEVMTMGTLELKNVDKVYKSRGKPPVHAVRSFHMEVGKGEIVALLGSSGCGKTSTL